MHTIRQLLKILINLTFNKKQIRYFEKVYFDFTSAAIDKAIRKEVVSRLNKINDALNNDHHAIIQNTAHKIIEFLRLQKVPGREFEFLFSAKTTKPTLYASAYACMILSLLSRLDDMGAEQKSRWGEYFDSYQKEADGLFYDSVLDSELFQNADWWGARHLALHMICAYTDLGLKPRYPFRFLEKYYDYKYIKNWLDHFDWNRNIPPETDIDNQIMNIGCLLQYHRDTWNDQHASNAVDYLQKYLVKKINPQTGIWGGHDLQNPHQRSRTVQFAYHLLSLFFYDHVPIQQPDRIVKVVLDTQNALGGFGANLNSSACEDIDSIYILSKFSPVVPDLRTEIDHAFRKALPWILCNQVDDGGFVFKLNQALLYGHPETSGGRNQGAMFPTWFRTLSLAYMARHFSLQGYSIKPSPGLEN
jgi:hypothetical protein